MQRVLTKGTVVESHFAMLIWKQPHNDLGRYPSSTRNTKQVLDYPTDS